MATTTPNYKLYKPELGKFDTLSDVAINFTNNNTKIINAAKPYKGVYANYAAIPSNFSGVLGDVIYLQDFKSEFIYLGTDSAWGAYFRPVQARYGPWVRIPNSVITDASYSMDTSSPMYYRLSNDGRMELKGGIKINSGTFPVYAGAALGIMAPLPSNIRPVQDQQWPMGSTPMPTSVTATTFSKTDLSYAGTSFVIRNWNSTATSVFFNGVSWQIGKI